MSATAEAPKMVWVRWEGNGSTRYDGRVQDIAHRFVVKEDVVGMAVGSTISVQWGRRRWAAVVVDLLDEEPEEAADDGDSDEATEPPAKKRRESKKSKEKERKGKSKVFDVHQQGGTCTNNICIYM